MKFIQIFFFASIVAGQGYEVFLYWGIWRLTGHLAILQQSNEENVKRWLHGKASISNATKVSLKTEIYGETLLSSYNTFKSAKEARSPSYEEEFMI